MNKKKIFKIIKFTLLIVGIFLLLFTFVNTKYNFFTSKDLFEKTNVVIKGEFKEDKIPSMTIDSNSNFLPFLRKKEIEINNLEGIERVYNVFEIDGLTPYTNYQKNIELKIEGIPLGSKIIIGSEEEKIEELTNDKDGKKVVLVNIDEDNSKSFLKGDSDYLQIPINFTTTEEGKAYIYLGIDTKDLNSIKYKISQVRIVN